MFYLQVSDLEACGKAPPSKFSDVIVAQVQSFYRNQLYSPTAIYSADLIMMPREQKEIRKACHVCKNPNQTYNPYQVTG